MKKILLLSIIAALTSCKCNKDTAAPVTVAVEDHQSITGTVTFTSNKPLNHIGKSSTKNVINSELLILEARINEQLVKQGLPDLTIKINLK
jgi:hypothetical protein